MPYEYRNGAGWPIFRGLSRETAWLQLWTCIGFQVVADAGSELADIQLKGLQPGEMPRMDLVWRYTGS